MSQWGTNKAIRYHYPIWFGYREADFEFDDSEIRNKKIRQKQKKECRELGEDYVSIT